MSKEQMLWQGKPSLFAYLPGLGIGILFATAGYRYLGATFSLAGSAVVCLLIIGIREQYSYIVTNQRIIVRKGLVGKRTGEVEIRDIKVINVNQSVWQAVLGVGTVDFTTASGPLKDILLLNIDNPEVLKEQIRQCRHVEEGEDLDD